jgi:hypothetical protein
VVSALLTTSGAVATGSIALSTTPRVRRHGPTVGGLTEVQDVIATQVTGAIEQQVDIEAGLSSSSDSD